MRALGLELLDDGEQVTDRAGEAIEPDHDQGLAGSDLAQQARQHRPGTRSRALCGRRPSVAAGRPLA